MQAVFLYLPRNSVKTGRYVFTWTGAYVVVVHPTCAVTKNSSCKSAEVEVWKKFYSSNFTTRQILRCVNTEGSVKRCYYSYQLISYKGLYFAQFILFQVGKSKNNIFVL
jgi:hypothetical protein